MRSPRFFETLTAALLALLMLSTGLSLAAPPEGKGNTGGDDGGVEPAPLPPIRYEIRYFSVGFEGAPGAAVNDMNNLGDCVGFYVSPEGERHAWICNPNADPNSVIDLNEIGAVGVPDGFVISSAVGINDYGAVVGYLLPAGSTGPRSGYVLDLSVDPPVLNLLPNSDPAWVDTYGRMINENGDVLGRFQTADGTSGAYVFNPGLYGTADAEPEVIPFPISHYNLLGALNNPLGDRPAQVIARIEAGNGSTESIPFRYTRGGQVELLEEVEGVKNDGFFAINDAGIMCGWTNILFHKKPKQRSFVTRFSESSMQIIAGSENIGSPMAINGSGDLAISNNSLSQFVYHDDWGLVDLWSVVTGTDTDLARWTTAGGHRLIAISERDTTGFGMIAGETRNADGTFRGFVLVPKLAQ